MVDYRFVTIFIAADPNKLSQEEIDIFNEAAGYSAQLTTEEKVKLYEDIHMTYDIEMDEMDEELNNKVTPTYMLIMQYMRNNW